LVTSDLKFKLPLYTIYGVVKHKVPVPFRPFPIITNTLRGRERERGIKTNMRVKLAAKMLVIVYPVKCEAYLTGAWALMKKKEPLNASYLKPENRILFQSATPGNNVGAN